MTVRAGAQVKICGLTESDGLHASVDAGAAYLGFNFFERSPRHVSPARAAELCGEVTAGICKVALVVDPNDAELDEILGMTGFDMVQLHGHESPKRVREIKALTGLPVMKALGISGPDDLPSIDTYADEADQLLIDTKPPKNAALPGGNGVTFDWNLIAGRRWPVPWMLAGGLTAENVREAMRQTGAVQVDLSSSVESAPGVKDPARIRAFLAAVSEGVPVV